MADLPEDPGNPYAPPAASVEASILAKVEGQRVRFAAGDKLPRICLRCGVKKGVKRRPQRLQWAPPETYLALPFGLLPYVVIVALVQKVAAVQLPFCDPCDSIWKNTGLVRGGLIIGSAVAVIVTLTLLNGAPVAAGVVALTSVIGIALARQRLLSPKRLRVRRIEAGGVVTLTGVNGVAAEAIEAMYEDRDA